MPQFDEGGNLQRQVRGVPRDQMFLEFHAARPCLRGTADAQPVHSPVRRKKRTPHVYSHARTVLKEERAGNAAPSACQYYVDPEAMLQTLPIDWLKVPQLLR